MSAWCWLSIQSAVMSAANPTDAEKRAWRVLNRHLFELNDWPQKFTMLVRYFEALGVEGE